jgi:hypothetical protein
MDRCEDWYASDDNLRGTPRGIRKKPNAGKPTGRLSKAMLYRGLENKGMVRAWNGRGIASVNQTRPQCVNQMGKTHSKPLAARHGRRTAWARHAMCESALTTPLAVAKRPASHQVLKFLPSCRRGKLGVIHTQQCWHDTHSQSSHRRRLSQKHT